MKYKTLVRISFRISFMSVNESRDIDNRAHQSNTNNVSVNICRRTFNINRRLLSHLSACRRKQQEQQNKESVTNEDQGNTQAYKM